MHIFGLDINFSLTFSLKQAWTRKSVFTRILSCPVPPCWKAEEATVTDIKTSCLLKRVVVFSRGFDCSSCSSLSDSHKKLTQRFQFCYCIVFLGIHGCFYVIRKWTQILDILANPRCLGHLGGKFPSQVTGHFCSHDAVVVYHLFLSFSPSYNTHEFDLDIAISILSLFIQDMYSSTKFLLTFSEKQSTPKAVIKHWVFPCGGQIHSETVFLSRLLAAIMR